jgi:hypothetical protein
MWYDTNEFPRAGLESCYSTWLDLVFPVGEEGGGVTYHLPDCATYDYRTVASLRKEPITFKFIPTSYQMGRRMRIPWQFSFDKETRITIKNMLSKTRVGHTVGLKMNVKVRSQWES